MALPGAAHPQHPADRHLGAHSRGAYHLLYPAILMFVCVGVFTDRYAPFDVYTVLVLGAVGYGMRLVDFPVAPLLLGFVLGPMMEEHFRRAMIISRGSFSIFVERPLSATFLGLTALMLGWAIWSGRRAAKAESAAALRAEPPPPKPP